MPLIRCQQTAARALRHIDIEKLERIERSGHRVTGNRRGSVDAAGWQSVSEAGR